MAEQLERWSPPFKQGQEEPPAVTRDVDLGRGIHLLWVEGAKRVGAEDRDPTTVRVEHPCPSGNGKARVIAPALQIGRGHTITHSDPVTVTPSVMCPDCGLHGHITNGVWVPA